MALAYIMDITQCPLCGMEVRIIRREDGSADHYEPLSSKEMDARPNPCPPVLVDYLRAKRLGKKTVALVGAAFTTAPWAPFGEEGVDIWACNESHDSPWMKEEFVSAWFQLHPKWSFTKDERHKHWEWLQKEHPFPIYMQMVFDDVPSSVKYPLLEIQKLINIERGEFPIKKIFSSTFNYQIALAIYQGFERIEIFGIELLLEGEYTHQREAMAYWLGKADGMGVEVWLPEQCSLLVQPLYAYDEIRKGDTGKIITE